MKKILLPIFIFIFAFANISKGQALLIILFGDKLSTETFQMGINASGAYTGLNNTPGDSKYRLDWAFGAFGEVKFADKWFLHFDLTLKTPAGADEVTPFTEVIPEIESLFTNYSITRKYNYITLPVYIKYKVGSVKFGVGGQIGYMTSAKDVYTGNTIYEDDFSMERDISSYHNDWDAGITGMIDYYFDASKNMKSMRLGLKYYYGLTDVLKENNGDAITNSIFMLSLGIPVGGSGDE